MIPVFQKKCNQNFQSGSTSIAQGTGKYKKSNRRIVSEHIRALKELEKKMSHAHFVSSVFEKIFSIGTSCFLHHAAVILRSVGETRSEEEYNDWQRHSDVPRVEVVDLTRSQCDLLPRLAIDHL
jgi:hypothetical protein